MKKFILLNFLILAMASRLLAQETFPTNDVEDHRERAYAFINGTIVKDYQTKIENGILIIKNGIVEAVGSNIDIPKGYTKIDLKGSYIYPSFVDPYTNYGIKPVKIDRTIPWRGREQISSTTKGAYNANEAIKSAFNAADDFTVDKKAAQGLRAAGFGAVLTFRGDGLARGTSTLVTLDESSDNKVMLNSKVAAHYSFTKGSSKQMYPVSTMGYIALLRQTYLDAKWYASMKTPPFKDLALEAWNNSQNIPQIFDTEGWMEILRADKLGDEFGVQYIIKGGGDEYQRINEVKKTNAPLIVPLNFPEAYDVSTKENIENVSLAEMKHWELAPTNAAVLEKNGINFAFTTFGLKTTHEYLSNIRKAIKNGLSESTALKAMTSTPASLLKESNKLGSLDKNKLANFIIVSKPLFNEKSVILENWVQGKKYELKPLISENFAGIYQLNIGTIIYNLEITGEPGKQSAKIKVSDSTSIKVDSKFEDKTVHFLFVPEKTKGVVQLFGWMEADGFRGEGKNQSGQTITWSAKKEKEVEEKKKDGKKGNKKEETNKKGVIIYPFTAHGNTTVPKQETILIKNATLWTNEKDGMLKNTDILLKDGKISKIGKNLSGLGARVFEASGKHVTSGIIDEHSHIAATSINDVATNSGMVRIGDVVDSEDEHIYTTLSGGVTAVQILHGSANPIGGQSALIKLRWGATPEELKIKNADGFIKFALGENVKRSSNSSSIRFPQTRMGVEQVYMDAFTSTQDYLKNWESYNKLSVKEKANTKPPRKDLVMETMAEILKSKRFITCHSYVQSEINMLMKVAEKFNFKINTFTHILEGYKVADKMLKHGVGASSFSDWWDYKWEVRYAIPYNAAIMNKVGIVVAINSDDAEMGRRLNQEAAKSIKYGGMSQEDAWKQVTLNPAKLLHLDDRMGSLKVGKDADVVIWSANPLSIYAKAETTIVDGTVYYDLKENDMKNEWIQKERNRLIYKMKMVKKSSGKSQKPVGKKRQAKHCDAINIDLGQSVQNH